MEMDSIEEENNRILIVRYLSGEASPEEVTELNKWLGASGANLLYFQQVKNIWYSSNRHSLKDLSDTNKAFKEVNKKNHSEIPRVQFLDNMEKDCCHINNSTYFREPALLSFSYK